MPIKIILTNGKICLIDEADFELVNQYNWYEHKGKNDKTSYAITSVRKEGKQKSILMHRLILSLTDSKVLTDHKDHDGLNNQRENIRISTPSLNQFNRSGSAKNSSSKYLGVMKEISKRTVKGKLYLYEYWRASIKVDGKNKYLGIFKIEEDAAKAYDAEAIKLYGEFANPNFKTNGK